ncbi:protein TolR [Aureimonas pseudogalii]|jgi:biopolymer transport protein TolR|uniref:Biopolymer transport protein TolR n=1 Tax=Aureimonas pseudogalii TaxID=1744844 RepID=A0A7W6E9U9_9HYPH|nr:protein TolR [Aureimonas pseudogalii]MBB3996939.1 biopolymer transport protein TolR [Aureimonas pseudogalii]
MGMSTGAASSGGGSRRRRGKRRGPMNEINMTPMVDVMLVLLIIFMVSAPMMTVGVPLELPKTAAKSLSAKKQPITISVQAGGEIFLQETPVAEDAIVEQLKAIAEAGYEERIFVRADGNAGYGTVMKVMARISAAGFRNIGLVTAQQTAGS